MAPSIDLSVERLIVATPEQIAAVMFDSVNDSRWMKAVDTSERVESEGRSQVRRTARFMGREIRWTTEVIQESRPRLLHLRILDGPFTGEVFYEIAPTGAGSTVRIRNVGEPGMFAWMPRAMITSAMRKALAADLDQLAQLVEAAGART